MSYGEEETEFSVQHSSDMPDNETEREKRQTEEIERLRTLIKKVYTEGWHDCYEHHEEYTIVNDWNKSKIKQALKEE